MTIVTLTEREMKFISKVGEYRTNENAQNHDIADYDKRRFTLSSLQVNRLGVMGEAAVVKHFGYDVTNTPLQVWPAFYLNEHASLYGGADVNLPTQTFEVRRVNRVSNPVAIRTKDVNANATIIQVYIEYVQNEDGGITLANWTDDNGDLFFDVHLLGWVDAVDSWDKARVPAWSTTKHSRVIDPNPMDTLVLA